MFDIGWSELVVIAVVALIAIGPKELPAVLRTVGQYMGKIRRMASEFQGQFQEAMREAEMADLKKSVDEMTDTAQGIKDSVHDSFTNFDPLADVKKEVDSFSADPLGTHAAAAASPEAATEATPAPLSPDAGIDPTPAPVTAAAPQPAPDGKPEPATEPKPGTGTPGSAV
jgi:sec-independent protein translocase protein TatB